MDKNVGGLRANSAFPYAFTHSYSKHFVLQIKHKTYNRPQKANGLLKVIYTDNTVVKFTSQSKKSSFRLAAIKTFCTKQSALPLWYLMTAVASLYK